MKISEQMLMKVERHKERIGELLLKHTALTEKQLEEALEIQKDSNLMIGEILLKKNYIHPHDIIRVVCNQVAIPYLKEINVESIDPNITVDLPINYAKHHEVLPLKLTSEEVYIVITDPI